MSLDSNVELFDEQGFMNTSELATIAAWQCEICHRYRSVKMEAPTMSLVAVPGPVEVLMASEPIETPFIRRRIIHCARCAVRMEE